MPPVDSCYTLSATTSISFPDAVERVREDLKVEGFLLSIVGSSELAETAAGVRRRLA